MYLKGTYLKGMYLKGMYLKGMYLKGMYHKGMYTNGIHTLMMLTSACYPVSICPKVFQSVNPKVEVHPYRLLLFTSLIITAPRAP